MKKIILLLLILTAITEGCKKYEDGPCISLRSAKHRLYGTYALTQYMVNTIDSLNLFNDSLLTKIKIYHDDVNNDERFDMYGYRNDGKFCMLNCVWKLANSKKTFSIITSFGAAGTGPIGNLKTPNWNILRLTNKEIKMETTYNGKEYLIELKQ